MRKLTVLVAAALATVVPPFAHAGQLPVVVPRGGFDLEDAARFDGNAAVGLLVPDAGPTTSERRARASLVRGEVVNSLHGELPSGTPLIETTSDLRRAPSIVLALPRGGEQPNDRRYPIAIVSTRHRGVLYSDSTRIPGLVSIVDVASTALGGEGALRSKPVAQPLAYLVDLDRRIRDNGRARLPAAALAAALIALLAVLHPRGAVCAFASLLLANLALGVAGVSGVAAAAALALAVGAGGPLLASLAQRPLVLPLLLACPIAAYLVAMAVDQTWVALSPLGPSQNGRFYGISNLLETLLLVPALAGAALAATRLGYAGAGAVAALALVTVAAPQLGADGGGALVLAAGYAALLALLAGGGRRAWLGALAAASAATAVIALDAVFGPSTHIGRSLRGGPGEVASDVADRLSLSWARATSSWAVAVVVAAAVVALALLVARLPRLSVPTDARALLVAFAVAIGVSLLVNDSPREVAVGGLVGYLSLERYARAREQGGRKLELRRKYTS